MLMTLNESRTSVTLPAVVTLHTLPGLLKKTDWQRWPVQTVDFSQVTQADSSVLSLLLVWFGRAKQPLTVLHFPAELKTLVVLYQLESVLADEVTL
jgi:ABC-type transporter Mla MlaB component